METGPGRTQSLYRKYRPETFESGELVGQDHVRNTLRNAIANGRVSHAYLFCGPRGTGKTTTARLLAKAVNCLDPDPAKRPCNACEACVAINQGRATDIIEIDAASNRGIEDIRDLREQVKYAPAQLRHKFYIIDEAHRLTRDAFNAFLKTLEEPPPNTTFVLATTDPDELLETVASRCQRFDFHRIPAEQMAQRARAVCEQEGIEIDDEALEIVIRQSTGSLRDALSLIDMLATATGDGEGRGIDAELTRKMLGLSQDERTLTLIEAILNRDLTLGLKTINDALDSGQDMRAFGRQILAALRLLMLCRAGANPAEADAALRELATRFELADLLRINREFSEIDFAIRHGGFPQLPIELAFVASIVDTGGTASAQPQPQPAPRVTSAPPEPIATARQDPPEQQPPPRQPEPRTAEPIPIRREPQPAPAQAAPAPDKPAPPPPATQKPASAPSAGSLPLESIVERWPEVRTVVKAADRKVEALLASCDPYNVLDDTLYLVAAYPFHSSKLNEDQNRMIIEDAVEQILGQRLSVSTGLRDELPDMSGPPSSQPAPQPAQQAAARQIRDGGPDAASNGESYDAEASDDDDHEQRSSEEEQQIMERMKAIFDGEEIDIDELPVDLDAPR